MAILKTNKKQIEVVNGTSVIDACENLGVPFGCTDGVCGTCRTLVKSGIENFGEKNEKENNMDLTDNERLMCQCTMSGGEAEIEVF